MGNYRFKYWWLQDERFKAWLKPVEGNAYIAHCALCNKILRVGSAGTKALEWHRKSGNHKAIMERRQKKHFGPTSRAAASSSRATQSSATSVPFPPGSPPTPKVEVLRPFYKIISEKTAMDDDDNVRWMCSEHQKMWMMTELQDLGLWPGCRPVHRAGNAISLWRFPPQPELVHPEAELPSPNIFQLHPFFIWKPEDEIMVRLRSTYRMPCLHGCPQTQIVSAGEGRPRAIVGTGGQYYILSSQLRCEICRKCWFADNPRWLEKLPERVTNILPALVTSKQAICKTVVDELRCTSKSPSDMVGQLNEILHLRYERAHLAYLHAVENVPRGDNTLQSFGSYEEPEGWCGVSVTDRDLKDCFIEEYMRQEQAINKLLQGTFGQVFRSDHARKPVEMEPTSVPPVDVKPESDPTGKMEPDSVLMKPPLSVTPLDDTPEQFFERFLESEYFQKEMEEAWCQVKKKAGKKRKRKQTWLMGRLCCFCRQPLREGPHVHTTFPGHAGKYIYCPSKVYNLYKDKGMDKEMTWVEFQASPFYDTEWQRWIDNLDRTGHCPLTPNVHPPPPFSASTSPRNSGTDGWTDDAHS